MGSQLTPTNIALCEPTPSSQGTGNPTHTHTNTHTHTHTQEDSHKPNGYAMSFLHKVYSVKKGAFATQAFVTITMGEAKMASGTIFGFSGITLPQLMEPNSDDLTLTKQQASLFASLVILGAFVGACVCGPLLVNLGQKTTLLIGMLLSVAAWFTMSLSTVQWVLLSATFTLGISYSFVMPPACTYTMEVTHEKYRGLISGVTLMSYSIGTMLPTYIGSSLIGWRILAMICGGFTFLPLIKMFSLPHSPRWLVTQGRINEARLSLAYFKGDNTDPDIEIEDIISQINAENKITTVSQLKMLFGSHLRRFLPVTVMLLLMGSSGEPTILAYLVPVMQALKIEFDPYSSAVLYSTMNILGAFFHLFVVDVIGRKPLIIIPAIISSACFIGLSILSYTPLTETNIGTWLPLALLAIVSFTFGVYISVCYTVQGELFPTECRAVGFLFLANVHNITSFSFSLLFPASVETIGQHGVFGVFSVSCGLLALVCLAIPETKGCTLEQIAASHNEYLPL